MSRGRAKLQHMTMKHALHNIFTLCRSTFTLRYFYTIFFDQKFILLAIQTEGYDP